MKNLLLEEIDHLFDEDIYEQVRSEKPTRPEINTLVRTKIRGLERSLGLGSKPKKNYKIKYKGFCPRSVY
jgi:hypothetical protein